MSIISGVHGVVDRAWVWMGATGIVLAYLGQATLLEAGGARVGFHIGWSLLLLGALLFATAWLGRESPFDQQPFELRSTRPNEPLGDAKVRVGKTLLGICIAAYVGEIVDWIINGETSRSRWLWGLSVLLLFAVLLLWRQRSAQPRSTRSGDLSSSAAAATLAMVVVIAATFRLVKLAQVPLEVHGDFTSVGLAARELLAGQVPEIFSVGWAAIPWPAYLPSALAMAAFGNDLFGLRMAGVITGLVCVIGTYGLTADFFSRRLALVAAASSAIGYVDLHFSRVGHYIDPLPWLLFGFWLLLRGVRDGSVSAFGASGMLLAVGFEQYFSGRLMAPVLVLMLFYCAVVYRVSLLRDRGGWLMLAAAAIVTSGPFPLYHAQHWDAFMTRSREVYAFSDNGLRYLASRYEVVTPLQVVKEQVWRSVLLFNYTTDTSSQFGFAHPYLHPALAPLFVLGAAWSASRVRRVEHALLCIWLVTGVVFGAVLTIDAPFWPRLVILLPVVAIMTSFGLMLAIETTSALIADRARRRPQRGGQLAARGGAQLAVVTAIVAAVGHQNYRWYFHGDIARVGQPIALIGRHISSAAPATGFCMLRGPLSFEDRVPVFLGRGRELRDVASDELVTMLPRCVGEGHVWILLLPDHDGLLDSLRAQWPQGREEQIDHGRESPVVVFWYPPRVVLAAAGNSAVR